MNITHTIRLVTSAAAAIEEIRKYKGEIVGAAQTVEKHANTLSGDRILKGANEWTAAVAKLGGATNNLATQEQLLTGVSQLTEKQKAQLNRTLSEAIEKYQLLGKEAPQALRTVHEALQPTPPLMERLAARTKSAGESFSAAGKLMLAVSATVASLGYIAIKSAMDYEAAMSTVQSMTGKTGDELDGLGQSFSVVFRQVPQSSQQVAQALAIVHRDLGATGKELEGLTKRFLDYARVGKMEVAESTRTVTQLMKALELDASTVPKVLDQIIFTSQKTGAGVGDLTNALISGGTMFREFGWSAEGAMALLGQFTMVGAKPIEVVQGLRQALVKMARDGITDTAGEMTKWIARIQAAETAVEGTAIASRIFGAQVAEQLTQEIRGGTFEIAAFEEQLRKAEGTLDTVAEETLTTKERFDRLKNAVSDAARPIGVTLLESAQRLMPHLERMVGWVRKGVEWFVDLPSPVQTAALGFGVFLVALSPVAMALGSMLTTGAKLLPLFASTLPGSLTITSGSFTTAGAAAKTFWTSVAWPVGVLAATVAGVVWLGDKLREYAGVSEDVAGRLAQTRTGLLDGSDQIGAKARADALAAAEAARAAREETEALASSYVNAQAMFEKNMAARAAAAQRGAGMVSDLEALRKEAQALSSTALTPLAPQLRELAVLFDKGGMSAKDIAQKLDVSEQAVKAYLESTKKAVAETKRQTEAFQAQVDVLTGKKLANELAELARQVEATATQGGLSTIQHARLSKEMADLRAKGIELPPVLSDLAEGYERTERSARATTRVLEEWKDMLTRATGPATQQVEQMRLQQRTWSDMSMYLVQSLPGVEKAGKTVQEFYASLVPRNDLASVQNHARKLAAEIDELARIGVPASEIMTRLGRAVSDLGEDAVKLRIPLEDLPEPIQDILRELGLLEAQLDRLDRIDQIVADIHDWVAVGSMLANEMGGKWGEALGHYADSVGHNADAIAKFMAGDISGGIRSGVAGLISLAKGIGALFGKSEARKELEAYNDKIRDMRTELVATYGSYQQIAALDRALGSNVAAGWWHQGKKGFEAWTREAEELARRLQAVKDEMADIASNGGSASAALIQFRDAMPEDPDVQAFVVGQVQAAGGAVGQMLDAIQRASTASAKAALEAQVADLREQAESLRGVDEDLRSHLTKQYEALEEQLGNVRGEIRLTAEGASAMAAVVLASWDGTAAGLRSLQPTLLLLQEGLESSGQSGSEAFRHLAAMAQLATHEVAGPLLEAIGFGTQALTNMWNSGHLTQEVFSGMVTEIMAQRDALLATGATADQVNGAMRTDLQRIWELVQDGRFAVDEQTQALLDQAEAAGTVGDRFRSFEGQMLQMVERIAVALESAFGVRMVAAVTSGAAAATRAIGGIPTDIDVRVHNASAASGGGGRADDGGLPGFRGGTEGRYLDFGAGTPVMLHGRERVMTEAEGRANTSGGITVVVNHPVVRERQDIRQTARELARLIKLEVG